MVNCEGQVCSLVIDAGIWTNVVSEEAVKKLALKVEPHLEPYQVAWITNAKLKVEKRGPVTFTIGKLKEMVMSDVLPYFWVIKDADLRERHLGDLQGLVHHEAVKLCPKDYRALSSRRTNQEIPGGGESLDQLYDRCTSALERISGKHKGERVVVVTHGGVIRSLFERASPSGQSGRVLNTSVNVFHLSDGDIWTIKSWGDVSHLNQTDYLNSGFGGDRTSG
ncbi:phosphoglycerate mutase family protein [Actinidia rufa]|uniref:Phosphoglycerate mutase family protein n=1 Tax=Actinidia rufa TaxID=165716 RepID=A0A7J0F5Z2_9ERIC|nr:phosphoglycerate mutase family protein [Actinidia rufa]